MDKFDEFIKNKAKEENESFSLPKSFEDKMESILEDIDDKENDKFNPWYKNRKVVAMAASLVLSCFVLLKLVDRNVDGAMTYEGAPKGTTKMESAADNSLFEISSAEEDKATDEYSDNIASDITLTLSSTRNEVIDIKGEDLLDDENSAGERIVKSRITENLQTLEVDRNENINITFSMMPNSYKVKLMKGNLDQDINYDQIESVEYPSENLILQAPNDTGIYVFEIIGNWNSGDMKYTMKIEVKN